MGHDPTIAPSQQIIFREVILRGSWLYKQHEWEGLLDFVRRREVPIKSLITHRFRPEDAVEAFELADRGYRWEDPVRLELGRGRCDWR